MYIKVAMMNLISITQARNNLSQLVRNVASKKQRYILIRDSKPQAVLIPYEEVIKEEENWQAEFDRLMKQGRVHAKRWLKKQGLDKKDLTEAEQYELINRLAGRR